MLKQTAAITIVVASILTAGCSDSEVAVTATGPSALRSEDAPFVGVSPSSVSAQLSGKGLCPEFPPFLVPVNLTVHARGNFSLNVREVEMRFVDASGITPPPITLPAPVLTRQFGTALVQARSARTFPLDFRFGCHTSRTGTIIIVVHVRDEHGRDDSTEIRVGVR